MQASGNAHGRLFGTNGIRGKPNELLTTDFVSSIGKAAATMFLSKRIAIGRDTRTSGAMVMSALVSGIMSTGTDAIDLGVLPTPGLQYYCMLNSLPGVMITASHNPAEYNGIKCIDTDGTELSQEKEIEIEKIHFTGKYKVSGWQSVGVTLQDNTAARTYIEAVLSKVKRDVVVSAGFRVAADPACGGAYYTTPFLLRELGCSLTTINGFPDGMFTSRNPEPRPENLSALLTLMKDGSYDIGIAHDGDADRAAFVDSSGKFVEGDLILSLLIKHRSRKGDVIVTPISTSDSVDDSASEVGATVIRTKVGAPIVARTMIDGKASLGGEENGGMIFGDHQYCRDGAMTVARVLEIMAETGKSLSELLSEVKRYHIKKGSAHFSGKWESLEKFIVERSNPERVDRTDGIKIYVKDGWALVRKSGTEPIVRVYAHSRTEAGCTRIFSEFSSLVHDFRP